MGRGRSQSHESAGCWVVGGSRSRARFRSARGLAWAVPGGLLIIGQYNELGIRFG